MPTQFFEEDVRAGLKQRRRLSTFLDALVLQKTGGTKKPRITCVFCTDAALLEKNIQFLDHDTLTDIITFDTAEEPGRISGELYISTERVRENAGKFGTGYAEELHRVIFHGVLHLCGYKDKSKKDIAAMREAEAEALAAWFAEDTTP